MKPSRRQKLFAEYQTLEQRRRHIILSPTVRARENARMNQIAAQLTSKK